MKAYILLLISGLLLTFSCKKQTSNPAIVYYNNGPVDSLKLNQITVLASHNSYHKRTDSAVLLQLTSLYATGLLPSSLNPRGIDYIHLPLTEQLRDYNIRGLELDVWNDPDGGHFYYRQGLGLAGYSTDSHLDVLKEPGFKLIHIPDFDYNSTNPTFISGLTEIKEWSDAHPNHVPVFINVETEVAAPADLAALPGFTHAVPFDATAANNLDMEVKSVFGANLAGVIKPDDVRGNYATLEQAVLAGNWPKLAQARGKVIFIVNSDGSSGSVYMAGHPSLQGRAMFVYVNPGIPEAAFVLQNNPKGGFAYIQKYVSQGYIVRTMSDDGTAQARAGDYSQMNAAFGAWAQLVSTDYYKPDYRAGTTGWTDYHVVLPGGGVARIDSISATMQLNLGAIKE